MEPFSIHPGGCSCTGCVYRSRSKEPNVQQLLQEGSDIYKLYFGKFLPLRKRKLLEKMIRTRDFYDGVRNQLLSASDQIIPKHKKKRRDEDLSSEQSSAVLQMVDLVDRGQMGPANGSKAKLSSCCNCCSCETLRKIRKRMEKEDKKHPKVHRQIVTSEDKAKYCEEAAEKGRKRRRKLRKISKLSSKNGSARLKIKRNLSEPTVISKSRAFVKRIRSKRKAPDSSTEIVTRDQKTKTAKGQRRNVKKVQSHCSEDSATELGTIAVKIRKDPLILFREKLLKQRPYDKNKHSECKPGTCKVGTCSPEECFKKIKPKGVGDTRRKKHHNRDSETGRHKSYISTKTRPKKVKVRESQVEIAKTKSSSSLTTLLKTKDMPSLSKTEFKGKIPVSTKPVKRKHVKSVVSMTFIQKLKAAQLATEEEKVAPKLKSEAKRRPVARDLEENVPVKFLPKSKATTKPATKSTSSLTSVANEKATKVRSKNIKTLERHKSEPASPPTRHKTGRQKPRREPLQNMEETDMQEPIEHGKVKKEKRLKPTHGRKQRQEYKHSKTQFAGALPKASKHSLLRDSASQSSKPHGRNVLSKSKSQGRFALASMERLKRKSAAFSQKTSSRSRTKSKQKQSKSADNFPKKSKYISKEPPPEIEENNIECFSNRQVVKLSSNFSYNIEFYKDTYPCVEVDEQPDFEPPQTPRPRRRIKQTQQRRKTKDQATGHIRSRHNMSSQSGSTQSFKSTQVVHELKRCICTQKLIQTKKQKLKYVESKKIMASLDTKDREVVARQTRTQTKQSGISYVVRPSTSTQASLLPYEWEPDFCSPGECDPYECLERIKQRNRWAGKHVSRDTNTTDTPKKSKVASTSHYESKSTSSKIQSSENRKIERKQRHTQSDAHSPKIKPKVSSDRWDGTGQRQAVRIGSNFNFRVEFSKTNINDRVTANAFIYDRPIQIERRQTQPKGIKVYKPSGRHEISEITKIVKTKQTRTEPFLQRCLCNLILLKKNSAWRNRDKYVMQMQNGAENGYNPERSNFLPYECEPGSCIPKECHPYDGEKLIKLRQIRLRHKYSNKCDFGSRSTFSKTSRTTTSSESQNTQFFTRESRQKVNKINQHYNEINITRDRFKQRVRRGGSNLSSKIEFSKEKSVHYKTKDNFITTEDCINKHTQNKYKSNTKGSQQVEQPAHHTSIDTKLKLIEKGSSVVSVVKKCINILKFPRKTNKLVLQNKNNLISESATTSHPFPSSHISEYKNILVRSSKLPYDLSSHERSPNFFIPRTCTPCGRHEENMRRDIIKLGKPYANMNRPKRKSFMSVTSDFSGSTMTKSTQPRLLKHRTKEDPKLRNKQRGMQAARSFSPSRLAVCEGTNFSFNKKKSTNRSIPSIRNTTIKNRVEKYNTVSDISTINRMKDLHCLSQENKFRKDHKASDVGLFLKKCFCRLALQKKNIPEREFHYQQPITTQFVQVEHNNNKKNRHNVTKSRCNVVNMTLSTKEPLQSKLPEDRYVFKENLIENQNSMKNQRYNDTRRGHIRSQIDVNFDKIKNLLNIQKTNPFYQSFYAFNVKVSKSKDVKSYGSFDYKADKKHCNSVERKKLLDYYERYKTEFEGKNVKTPTGPDKPLILGSDFKIRPRVYKDTNPYKDRHQAVPIGSDARVEIDFFRELRRNDFFTGPTARGPIPKDKMMMEGSRKSFGRLKTRQGNKKPNNEHQQKPSGIKFMMRQLSKRTVNLKRSARSDISQRMGEMCICRDPAKHNSITRLPKRRETSQPRYVQGKECAPGQKNPACKFTDRNNVTFFTDVNCLKYAKERPQKQRASINFRLTGRGGDQVKPITKANLVQGKGEGDVEKQNGPIEGKKTVMDCLSRLKKNKCKCMCEPKTKAKSPTICTCGAKTKAKSPTICTCGAKIKAKSTTICTCGPKTEAKSPTICKCGAKTKAKSPTICTCGAKTEAKSRTICTCGAKTEAKSTTICTCRAKTEARSPTICTCRAKTEARSPTICTCGAKTEARSPTICTCGAKTEARSPTICTCGAKTEAKSPTTCTCGAKTKAKSPTICTCGAKTKAKSPTICTCGAKTEAKSPTICTCGAKTEAKSPTICTCGAKTKAKSPIICTCGAKTEAKSPTKWLCKSGNLDKNDDLEVIRREKKRYRQLEKAERELETIMPYSKKKFKKLKSQSKLPTCTFEQNVKVKYGKEKQKTPKFPVRVSPSFECLCYKEAPCPVCRDKAKGKFRKGKNKLICTCRDEEIVPEKPKNLTNSPMRKESVKKKTSLKLKVPQFSNCKSPFSLKDGRGAVESPVEKPVDYTPCFEITLYPTDTKIINKQEVLKDIAKSSKEAQAEKEKGPIEGRKTMMDCLRRLTKNKDKYMYEPKTEAKSPTICTCGAKTEAKSPTICTCGAKTEAKSPTIWTCGAKTEAKSPTICKCGAKTKAKSPTICTCGAKTEAKSLTKCLCKFGDLDKHDDLEVIRREKKRYRQLEKAERELETIMPYSKKKFKKLKSQSKLPTCTFEQNVKEKYGKEKQKTSKFPVRVSASFECLYNKESRLRRLCPVCRDKAKGKFRKGKSKLKCTCRDEEIEKGPIEGRKTVMDCLRRLIKNKHKYMYEPKTEAKSPTICTCGAKTEAKSPTICTCGAKTEAKSPTICKCGAKTEAKSPTICTCGAKTEAKSPTICTCRAKTEARSPTICTCGSKTEAKSPTTCTCGAKTKAKSPTICICGAKTKAKSPTICTCGAKTEAKSPTICTCGAKTEGKSPTICTCGAKTKAKSPIICTCGAKTEAKSPTKWLCKSGNLDKHDDLEVIRREKKRYRQLEKAERELETTMPYLKKKFKKLKSQSKLPKCTFEQNVKAKKATLKTPKFPVRVSPSFECCNKEARCPVCGDKAKGKFRKGKNKLKCTCRNEEIEKALVDAGKKVDTPRAANKVEVGETVFKLIMGDDESIGDDGMDGDDRLEALKFAMDHGSKCNCCVCSSLKKGKALAGTPIALKPKAVSKPFVSGSTESKKDKIKQEQAALAVRARKLRKCVCGRTMCALRSSKLADIISEEARHASYVQESKKIAEKEAIAYQKARLKRKKIYEKERKLEEGLRIKHDKEEMESIEKNNAAGDVYLLAESLVDLSNFGSKAFSDVATAVYRAVSNPRDTINDIRDASSDPGAAAKCFLRHVAHAGLFATAKRIKARFAKMPTVKRVFKALKCFAIVNFIIRLADKDPNKRVCKKRKRSREPLEFGCNPYMASMRKRPCLSVYYMWPWFYPYCVNFLGLWKRFLNILLFILAAAVWTPCIMCTELCRCFMCCVMGQG